MSVRRVLAVLPLVAAALTGGFWALARGASEPESIVYTKLEAPIDLQLRPVDQQLAQGRCRLEVRASVRAPLTDLHLRVELPAGARLLQGPAQRSLQLKPGEALRDELALGWEPGHGGTLVVGVFGRLGNAVLGKTQDFDLGPVQHVQLKGTLRTDSRGRNFFEVPATAGGRQP